MAEGFAEYNVRGKSKFGGQANKIIDQAEEFDVGDSAAGDIKERFLLRLRIGIPLILYQSRGRGKTRAKRPVELYTENDARTLIVDDIDYEFYRIAAKATRLQQTAEKVALEAAAVERAKERAQLAAKKKLSHSHHKSKNMDLRTVDIKDLWQADVEYGDLEKHTILDWADGTTLDLEGCDIEETLFLHKGLSLCLDDWTKNTSEYSDFWDSL